MIMLGQRSGARFFVVDSVLLQIPIPSFVQQLVTVCHPIGPTFGIVVHTRGCDVVYHDDRGTALPAWPDPTKFYPERIRGCTNRIIDTTTTTISTTTYYHYYIHEQVSGHALPHRPSRIPTTVFITTTTNTYGINVFKMETQSRTTAYYLYSTTQYMYDSRRCKRKKGNAI